MSTPTAILRTSTIKRTLFLFFLVRALVLLSNILELTFLVGRFLGYAHAAGEVHISENNQWLSCPGHDNTSSQCIVGDVPNIFEGNPDDHSGPYNGITMGC